MSQAIANTIGVSVNSVVLSFTEVLLQRRHLLQQRGVLVDVGLQNYLGSPDDFTSSLTESNLNAQMVSLGLRSIQNLEVLTNAMSRSTQAASSTSTNNTNSSSNPLFKQHTEHKHKE
jgi:hypothetical protein